MAFGHGPSGAVAIRPLAALTVGAIAAVGLSLLHRGADHGIETGTDAHAIFDAQPTTRLAERDASVTVPATASATTAPALATQAELRGASESFRNSTLLIAIRENGFVCAELAHADQSEDPLGGWHVACRGALAYFVAVGESGELVVEPVPVGDNLVGRPAQQLPQDQLPPLTPPNR